MQLLNEVKEKIIYLGGSGSASVMAQALLSACTSACPAPPFISISSKLDKKNKVLVARLMDIISEPDYSNADQDEISVWLMNESGFGEFLNKQMSKV